MRAFKSLYFWNANNKKKERNTCLLWNAWDWMERELRRQCQRIYMIPRGNCHFICFVTLCRLISYLSSIDCFSFFFHLVSSLFNFYSDPFLFSNIKSIARVCVSLCERTSNNAVCSCGFWMSFSLNRLRLYEMHTHTTT